MKEVAEKLASCEKADLINAIDTVDYSRREWREVVSTDWEDVLNRFDTIIEQAIAKSSILRIGMKKHETKKPRSAPLTQHQQQKASTSSSTATASSSTNNNNLVSANVETAQQQDKLVDETPEPELLRKILSFTTFLLKREKEKKRGARPLKVSDNATLIVLYNSILIFLFA